MKCFRCLVEYQRNERQFIDDACFVYAGQSLCFSHINIVRGHAPRFDRYPKGKS